MTTETIVKLDGREVMRLKADWAQACCPIVADGQSTPFQVADARHRERSAAIMINSWYFSEGGAAWDEDRDDEIEVCDADED